MKFIYVLPFALAFQFLRAQDLRPVDIRQSFYPSEFFYPDSVRSYTGMKPLPEAYFHDFQPDAIKTSSRFANWIFNRDFFYRKGKDYALRITPLLVLELGKTNDSTKNVFRNTRGIKIDVALGKQVVFSTSIYENQGRFPGFYSRLYEHLKPANGLPATIPGEGIAKAEKNGVLDFPVAEGFIRYKPSRLFVFEIGHGKTFIGEGYWSLFLSGQTGPIPYFRFETRFWHVRYMVMWSMLQDIRPGVMHDGFFYKKYMAVHFLDWAVTKSWNLGVYESVIWDPVIAGRGFDLNFLNPVIFFKTAEFQSGTKTGNTVLGLQSSLKLPYKTNLYGQFLLDEMTISKFFGDPGYWGNKYGIQLGIKTAQTFGDHRFFGRLEWNRVRPYTYSHHLTTINYGHNNWVLAHPFGANFNEVLMELKWYYKRWFAGLWGSFSRQGLDFPGDPAFYGADIFRDYEDRIADGGIHTLQGNLRNLEMFRMEAGWEINPRWHLQVYTGAFMRNSHIEQETALWKNEKLLWLYGGIRTALFKYQPDY